MIDNLLLSTADTPFFEAVRQLVDELEVARVERYTARAEATTLRRQLAECQAQAAEDDRIGEIADLRREVTTLQHWLQLAHAALDTAGVCLACYGSGRVDGRHCTACHGSGRGDTDE